MEGLLKALWCISVLYPFITTTSQTDNAALFKEARQSKDYEVYYAPLGIDGRRDATLGQMSCTHTQEQTNPWWRVDMLVPIAVAAVRITNRQDCCPERLDGAEIRIGNNPANNGNSNPRCALISHIAAEQTFQCGGMEGRYVNVIIPGELRYLTLCEVEVLTATPDYTILRGLQAAQSSLYFAGDSAGSAVNGVRTTVYPTSCTSTAQQTDPWWTADLGGLYRVTAVTITNRLDCCPERLDGAEIRVGYSLEDDGKNNPRCATVARIAAGESDHFLCVGMVGRYVTVVIPGPNRILTLCQMDVFGFPAVNVAPSGTASQSSSYVGSSSPQVAIDGDKKPVSCIQTSVEAAPWWRVDLGAGYRITAIGVTNRDTNPEWLDNAEICIGDTLDVLCQRRCAVISHIAAGQTQTFACDGMDGCYVTVSTPGDSRTLQICEVEIYGVTLDTFPSTTPPPTTTPTPPPPVTTPPPPPTPAPSASVQLGGRMVTLVGERLCWSDALFYCRDRDLDLLSLASEEEQRGLEALLGGVTFPLTPHLWLGLRRSLQGSDWFWMSGHQMTYMSWLRGSAPPAQVSRPCGAVANGMDFLWEDRPCKEPLNFLCFSGANDAGVTRVGFYSSYRN
ncbi:uncharacterized protein LOC134010021 isoform X2 [Osmerus eperlanus]|uniref:uncharacterized protein LOC134010021 isoform X2 n=1 Tax=Osmerus eperlanus TaxID=29151 RepID=UPI002E136BB8